MYSIFVIDEYVRYFLIVQFIHVTSIILGKNVAEVFQIKRSDREETIKLSIHPQDYQGLVLIGLAHDSPEMHTTPIMNKSSVVEENCELI